MRALAPLPVLLPLLGAGLTLVVGRHPRGQRVVSTLVLTAVVAVSATLLVLAERGGARAVAVGGWPPPPRYLPGSP